MNEKKLEVMKTEMSRNVLVHGKNLVMAAEQLVWNIRACTDFYFGVKTARQRTEMVSTCFNYTYDREMLGYE